MQIASALEPLRNTVLTSKYPDTYKYMALLFLPIFEDHKAFLLVVKTNGVPICCLQNFAIL